jgi:hypothetical protein
MAMSFEDLLLKGSGIDPYSDRDVPRQRFLDDFLDSFTAADISGIDAEPVSAGLEGGESKAVVKVDVRNQRGKNLLLDLLESFSSLFIRHGQPHNVTPGSLKLLDLPDRRIHIPGVRVGHGLNRNGRPAADRHLPDMDLASFLSSHLPGPLR